MESIDMVIFIIYNIYLKINCYVINNIMCFICSDKVPIEKKIAQLKEIIDLPDDEKNTKFDDFNTTSVFSLLYSCSGMYGEEAKELSIKILREFVKWMRDNKQLLYLPKSGLEVMFHPILIEKTVDWCEEQDLNVEKHEMLDKLRNKFNELNEGLKKSDLTYRVMDKYYSNIYMVNKDKVNNVSFNIKLFLIGSIIGGIVGIFFRRFIKDTF